MRSYLVILLLALATVACSTILAPLLTPGTCSPRSLLLSRDYFPDSTWATAATTTYQNDAPFYEGNESAGMQTFTTSGDIIFTEYLYRFRTPQSAQSRYAELERPWFPQAIGEDDLFTPWSPIPDSDLVLPSHDRARAGCRVVIDSGGQECAYVAQVGPYVVQIFANLPPMTSTEFASAIRQAEDFIASCSNE